MIDLSGPFIRRPVGTILLAIGLFLAAIGQDVILDALRIGWTLR